jgi:hypothetical protein
MKNQKINRKVRFLPAINVKIMEISKMAASNVQNAIFIYAKNAIQFKGNTQELQCSVKIIMIFLMKQSLPVLMVKCTAVMNVK